MIGRKVDKSSERNIELNVIGNGVKIKGDIVCDKDFRLDGFIEGTLRVNAKLVIGKTGKVYGTIHAINSDISGEVQGNIEVKEFLILRESAVVNGDIKTNKINIENGAEFNGNCTMSQTKGGESPANKPNTSNQVQQTK